MAQLRAATGMSHSPETLTNMQPMRLLERQKQPYRPLLLLTISSPQEEVLHMRPARHWGSSRLQTANGRGAMNS